MIAGSKEVGFIDFSLILCWDLNVMTPKAKYPYKTIECIGIVQYRNVLLHRAEAKCVKTVQLIN